jgi:hypothetical protein
MEMKLNIVILGVEPHLLPLNYFVLSIIGKENILTVDYRVFSSNFYGTDAATVTPPPKLLSQIIDYDL